MSGIRSLAKDTVIYGFGQALKKLIGLILLPFFTRALGPAEYGVLDTLATAIYFLGVILALGIEGATGRYFFIAENETERGKLLYTSLLIRITTQFLPILILLPFSAYLSNILFGTPLYRWVVVLALLTLPVQNISTLQEVIFRYYRKPWKYLIVSLIRAVLVPTLGITFVVVLQWGVLGATLSNLVSSVLILLVALLLFSKSVYYQQFSWMWAKKMLVFGYPLVFMGLMLWVNNVSDRFFLLHYADLTQIGLYAIGNVFSQPILFINMALSMSFTVIIMSLYRDEKDNEEKPQTKAFLTLTWHIYLVFAATIAMIVSIFSYEIVFFVTTPEYVKGIMAIPFLLFSHILYQSAQITGNGMNLKEKSKPYVWIMLVAAALNVGLNIYFIPLYGFVGAAFTTLVSNFAYFAIAYFWSQRYFYVQRSFGKPTVYLLLSLCIALIFPFAKLWLELDLPLYSKFLAFGVGLALPFIFGLIKLSTIQNAYFLVVEKINHK